MPLELLKTLLSRPSLTPEDSGCQSIIAEHLKPAGFIAETLPQAAVSNLWLRRGNTSPLLVFAGHTDVVPPGDRAHWNTDPFTLTEKDGYLYGRGTADMKGGLAACITACERFVRDFPQHKGSIALLLTSDEEGEARDGTRYVMETLNRRGENIQWCVVVEPSSTNTLGDTIRNGRRGSLSATLTIIGKQGHIAYPEKSLNPIHIALPVLHQLAELHWDDGNEYFPPSHFQFSRINSDAGASNVTPAILEADFNLRFCTEINAQQIRSRIEETLQNSQLEYQLDWKSAPLAEPFLTKPGQLIEVAQETLYEINGSKAALSAGGGTSDGRFIAPTCHEVIELGLVNQTIHQVNECIKKTDLECLTKIYQRLIEKLLT